MEPTEDTRDESIHTERAEPMGAEMHVAWDQVAVDAKGATVVQSERHAQEIPGILEHRPRVELVPARPPGTWALAAPSSEESSAREKKLDVLRRRLVAARALVEQRRRLVRLRPRRRAELQPGAPVAELRPVALRARKRTRLRVGQPWDLLLEFGVGCDSMDLRVPENAARAKAQAAQSLVVHLGVERGTFSRAREKPVPGADGPRPLRSRRGP